MRAIDQGDRQDSVLSLFRPRSMAIVGASDRPGSWTANVRRNLMATGFSGPVLAVNPRRTELWGEACYPTVADLPEHVEHLVVAVPREQVVESLRQGATRGVRGATIISSGFADTGTPEGVRLQQELLEVARDHDIRLIGPNCFGWVSVMDRVNCMAYPRMPELRTGPVALVSQSGGAVPLIAQSCGERGIGVGLAVSIGNAADVSIAEVIRGLCDEPTVESIALLLESVDDWEDFLLACRQATESGRRVVAVKGGRSEQGSAASATHTGRLAGDYSLFAAAFHRAGGILADSLDQLVDILDLLSTGMVPVGTRARVLVTSGNLRALFLDEVDGSELVVDPLTAGAIEAIGSQVGVDASVANPVDAGFAAVVDDGVFGGVAEVLAREPETDLVAVFGKLEKRFEQRYLALAELARSTGVPIVLFGRLTANVTDENREIRASTGLPYIPTVRRLIEAVAAVAGAGRAGPEVAAEAGAHRLGPELVQRLLARTDADGMVDHVAVSGLLVGAGLTVAPQGQATDPDGAVRLADELGGYPVVAKLIAPGLSHKTEIGGVRVGLAGPQELAEATGELLGLVPVESRATASVLVQPVVAGVEVMVGARTDPELGAFIVAGSGGVMAELLADVATASAPLSRDAARAMVAETLVGRLLPGFRGRPPLDADALIDLLVRLGDFVRDNAEWIESMDLNPVMLGPEGAGAIVVDARIAVRQPLAGPSSASEGQS